MSLISRLALRWRVVAVVELKQRALRAQAGVVPRQVKGVELVVRGVTRGLGAGAVAVRQPQAGPVHHELRRRRIRGRAGGSRRIACRLGSSLGERRFRQRAWQLAQPPFSALLLRPFAPVTALSRTSPPPPPDSKEKGKLKVTMGGAGGWRGLRREQHRSAQRAR